MGSYLGRARPRPPSPSVRVGDQRERPQRLRPAHPARDVPPVFQVHSAAHSLELTRKRSSENRVASPFRREQRGRLTVVHRRRCPIQKAWCLFLGAFSSVSCSGYKKQPVLFASSSRMLRTSVMLKMASAKGKLMFRLALEESVVYIRSSLAGHLSNSNAKKTLMRALEKSCQVRAKEEKDLTTLEESGEGLAKLKEGCTVPPSQDDQRRDSSGCGSAQSAFRRLMVNGVLSSFVPRPGPLKTDFGNKSSVNSQITKSQTSFMSSCSKRNAITSSYSSTKGFPSPQKRNGPGTTGLHGLAPSHSQVPGKKASEEDQQASSSASVVPQRTIKHEKVVDASSGQKRSLRNQSPIPDSSRPQKRKSCLLLPCRRNNPLILPPATQLGYQVTAEDLDLEKRAAIQWINKVLKGKTISDCSTFCSSCGSA
ncbi:PREDICTED: nuclear envelope pore membrane protein POM 121-like [Galeopterus variegatus]|uniref:Nuclear envelope pore membrane protein POM 121-like n=1 Tax=Galeopterus variegatus TaxID=482537 RepID=A0ABM0QQU8_GALVR|nr:PREDICTED: nuclear envelope pore membrane protein POM 121-like [Galeopterus variegatus]